MTIFVGCMSTERANAVGILDAMKRATEMLGLDWVATVTTKLIGMGSDGASVMLGKENGVGKRLQEMNPAIVTIHCFGHR